MTSGQVLSPRQLKCRCLAFSKCSQKVSRYYLTAPAAGCKRPSAHQSEGQGHLLEGSGSPSPGSEAGCLSPLSVTAGDTDSCSAVRSSLCGSLLFCFSPLWGNPSSLQEEAKNRSVLSLLNATGWLPASVQGGVWNVPSLCPSLCSPSHSPSDRLWEE